VLKLKFEWAKDLAIGLAIFFPIFLINFFYFQAHENLFYFLNFLSLLLLFVPFLISRYKEHKRIKEIEEMFHVFLRDFVQAIRSGMSIPVALKTVAENDYKSLTPFVKKMSSQLEWGIPLEKVLLNFSKQVKSRLIGRIVSSIIESHEFGGNLSDTLDALRATALETEKLREERKLYLHSQMITGYIIFFVFLAVIIGLKLFLIPSLTEATGKEVLGVKVSREELIGEYETLFRNIILIQGFFAGLSVGKMAEGAVIAGLKHSIFMMVVGILIYMLAS